jgi:SnoaL-like domain
MAEESTTPDLVELTRRSIEAQEESIEAAVSFYAPDGIWDASWGMGVFQGQDAVRGFFTDWRSAYDEMTREIEAIRDLGNGVTFAVIVQAAPFS